MNTRNDRTHGLLRATAGFTSLVAWLSIVASPTVFGAVLGGLVHVWFDNVFGDLLCVALVITGVIVGIMWAEHARRTYTTIHFVSRGMATPDLDTPVGPEQCPVCAVRMPRPDAGKCGECGVDLSRAARWRKPPSQRTR